MKILKFIKEKCAKYLYNGVNAFNKKAYLLNESQLQELIQSWNDYVNSLESNSDTEKVLMLPELNSLINEIHNNAVKKGFWENDCKLLAENTLDVKFLYNYIISQKLMLIVSELGEAQEALRINKRADLSLLKDNFTSASFVSNVKDTFEDELADVIIRLFDLIAFLNIDIEKHIEYKMRYNSTRDKLHGKEF